MGRLQGGVEMNMLSRRLALRSIAMAVPAAIVVAETTDLAKLTNETSHSGDSACALNAGTKFSSFADWLSKYGHASMKLEARATPCFDADIIDMRLPLVTKVRLQRTRNYSRLLERRKSAIAKEIGLNGFYECWI